MRKTVTADGVLVVIDLGPEIGQCAQEGLQRDILPEQHQETPVGKAVQEHPVIHLEMQVHLPGMGSTNGARSCCSSFRAFSSSLRRLRYKAKTITGKKAISMSALTSGLVMLPGRKTIGKKASAVEQTVVASARVNFPTARSDLSST